MAGTDKTSWGNVANWYDALLDGQASNYQKDVILPNITRCLSISSEQRILDLACGQGFFTRAFASLGAQVMGQDIASELIQKAKQAQTTSPELIAYYTGPADDLSQLPASARFDVITIILAIQNISNPTEVFRACASRLAPGGKLALVLNHPAFRVPKSSDWGWDAEKKLQYRRVDRYSSEFAEKILMHPGSAPDVVTYSFHRPLQYYVKQLCRAGFLISGMEEWVSNKRSDSGPRAQAENVARREIPLFLYLEACKV